jgi:hypothetical protein
MFTGETAACMLVGEHASVMLLSREKFAEFAKLPMADPTTHTLALYCFSVSAREEVDTVAEAALAAGGAEADGPRGPRLHVLTQLLRPRRPRLAGHVDGSVEHLGQLDFLGACLVVLSLQLKAVFLASSREPDSEERKRRRIPAVR